MLKSSEIWKQYMIKSIKTRLGISADARRICKLFLNASSTPVVMFVKVNRDDIVLIGLKLLKFV